MEIISLSVQTHFPVWFRMSLKYLLLLHYWGHLVNLDFAASSLCIFVLRVLLTCLSHLWILTISFLATQLLSGKKNRSCGSDYDMTLLHVWQQDVTVGAVIGKCWFKALLWTRIGTWTGEILLFRLCFLLAKTVFNPGSQQTCGISFATTAEKTVMQREDQDSVAHFERSSTAFNWCCLWQQYCSIGLEQCRWMIQVFLFKLKTAN